METITYEYTGLQLKTTTASSYGYDAIDGNAKRKAPSTRTSSEDIVLTQSKRRTMNATVRDTVRNFALVAWMCRKHLDYVTRFSFKASTPDADFNRELEEFIDRNSERENFHVSRRHPLRRFLRIAEGRRVLDGDFGIHRYLNEPVRGKVQGFESDLISTPSTRDQKDEWVNGVRVDSNGAAVEYGLSRRKGKGLEFARTASADDFYLHAYYDSAFRHDQVRGISPFSAALNTLRDTGEIMEYTKARHKVAQMFGLVINRNQDDSSVSETESDSNTDGRNDEINFSDGPQLLDLDMEEDAKFLENKTSADETVAMLRFLMQLGLMALDIPTSIMDERETTFFGGRGALMQYLTSARTKIEDNKELLTWWAVWRILVGVMDGEITLPVGLPVELIQFSWCPAGVPWWDPAKEIAGHAGAIASCITTFDDVIKEVHGGRHNVEENIKANAKAFRLARELGFPLMLPGVALPDATAGDNDSEDPKNADN